MVICLEELGLGDILRPVIRIERRIALLDGLEEKIAVADAVIPVAPRPPSDGGRGIIIPLGTRSRGFPFLGTYHLVTAEIRLVEHPYVEIVSRI